MRSSRVTDRNEHAATPPWSTEGPPDDLPLPGGSLIDRGATDPPVFIEPTAPPVVRRGTVQTHAYRFAANVFLWTSVVIGGLVLAAMVTTAIATIIASVT